MSDSYSSLLLDCTSMSYTWPMLITLLFYNDIMLVHLYIEK